MILLPLVFTLFPYTTLFRSPAGDRAGPGHLARWRGRVGLGALLMASGALCEGRRGTWSWADRKSTRLNSSHQIISYAVYCLKKKNRPRWPARSASAG